ncbi:hypothetical protein CJP55_04050 [Lactobacillus plantarum]|nr:hypothetical protein [Lactiplantibacillus plantarum]
MMKKRIGGLIVTIAIGLSVVCILIFRWYRQSNLVVAVANHDASLNVGQGMLKGYDLESSSNDFHKGDTVSNYLDTKNYAGSILLVKNNSALFQRGFGYSNFDNRLYAATNTEYRLGSAQNLVTGMMIGKAIQKQQLSWNSKLDSYFPKVRGSRNISIQSLVSGRARLSISKKVANQVTDLSSFESITGNIRRMNNISDNSEATNYLILMYVLESIYGEKYQQLYKSQVAIPLNLSDTNFVDDSVADNQRAVGYLKKVGEDTNYYNAPVSKSIATFYGYNSIYANTSNLYILEQALLKGNFLSNKIRNKLVDLVPNLVNNGSYYTLESSLPGFQIYTKIKEDGASGVVLMSNYGRESSYMHNTMDFVFQKL